MREKIKSKAIDIFTGAIERVDPKKVTTDALGGLNSDFGSDGRLFIVGLGKAAFPMAQASEDFFGDKISKGAIVTKYGHGKNLQFIEVFEAGHPVPDENGVRGTQSILEIVKEAQGGDIVLLLISGGGSSLFIAPIDRISLSDLKAVNQSLTTSGADIYEINSVRKHLSNVKGGNLASAAYPARVISLILSDVVGDDISTIASGPTAPDPTTFRDALSVIEKYDLTNDMPKSVMDHLSLGSEGRFPETFKKGDPIFDKVKNIVVGDAKMALAAAQERANDEGFNALVLSSSFTGDTGELSRFHRDIAMEIVKAKRPIKPPACIISGGESTVHVKGSGKGGRNTQFALHFAIDAKGIDGVYGLFCGSDGTDGPTDAAGAFAAHDTIDRAEEIGLDAESYLVGNDSYTFFESLGDLIITGPTKTNVMDIRLVFVV